MIRLRLLLDDIELLWIEYQRQRAGHPKRRRLELIRVGLAELGHWDFLIYCGDLYASSAGRLLKHNGDTWVDVGESGLS